MNILQLPRRFARNDWGGTETVVLETCKELLRRGHQTEIVCTNATADNNAEMIDGVRVTRYRYFYPYIGLSAESKRVLDKKGGNPVSLGLWRALRRFPPLDVIHLHTGNRIGALGRHEALRRRIPYVISLHGGRFDQPPEEAASLAAPRRGAFDYGKLFGLWWGSRRVLEDAAAIICVGKREQELAQAELPHKRVTYIPNGVHTDRFATGDGATFRERYGIPADRKVLLTVARIDTQKNQLLLARALPALQETVPQAHVLLVGHVTNQDYLKQIEQTARDTGRADRLTVVPGIASGSQELVDAYHAADLFVLPSIHEPFGIVILEAWSAGLPVLASAVGGVPYFLEDNVDGVLFAPDDLKGFVAAAGALLNEPARGTELAEAGRSKARHQYGWDKVTDRLVGVYEAALAGNSAKRRH